MLGHTGGTRYSLAVSSFQGKRQSENSWLRAACKKDCTRDFPILEKLLVREWLIPLIQV